MAQFSIVSKQNDIYGIDKYRFNDVSVPVAYRHNIEMQVAENPRKTSNTVTVRSVTPIVKVIDGSSVSTDSFVATTKFTALQQVTNAAERAACFDKHVAFLLAARADILEGRLPLEPVSLA